MNKSGSSLLTIYKKSCFTNDYSKVIKFNNSTEMNNFFDNPPNNLLEKMYENNTFSFIKASNNLKVGLNENELKNAKYMRFKNKGRMWYAFILDTHYLNETTTEVVFEIDVFNSYQEKLFNESKISGFLEQGTLKRKEKNGNKTIFPTSQGINIGTKRTITSYPIVPILIDWLVIVLKPTAKINSDDSNKGLSGFTGSFSSYRYFIIPIDLSSGVTRSFNIGNKTYMSVEISEVMARLTNNYKKDGTDTVNQSINVYSQKYLGIPYTSENGVIKIESDFFDFDIHKIIEQ